MDKTNYIKANSVAFSGHHTIAEDSKDEIMKKLRGKIRLLYAMGITNFYCGMALGFDMLATEVVISLKVELGSSDKGNDLSANNIIPQGQNILCTFSCADNNGFVEGSYMPIQQSTYKQAILQTQVAV